MDLNVQKIIKLLPWEEAFRQQLLEGLASQDLDKKVMTEQLIWQTFYRYFEARLETNMRLAMLDVEKGTRNFEGKDLYQEITTQTEQEIQAELNQQVEAKNLDEAKKAMEFIVKEIHASKTPAGKKNAKAHAPKKATSAV